MSGPPTSNDRSAVHPRHRPDQLLVGQSRVLAHRGSDVRGVDRGLQTLHPQRADGVDLRLQQHAVRHAVHDVRRLHAGAGRTRARRLRLHLHEAAGPGLAGPDPVPALLHSVHDRPHLRGQRFRGRFLAHRRALDGHGRGTSRVPLQDGHPGRRRAGHAAGARRDRPLRPRDPHGPMATAAGGRRGDRRHRDPGRPQRIRRRGIAAGGHGRRQGHRRGRAPPQRHGRGRHPRKGHPRRRGEEVSDPSLGLTMLGLIVVAIMMGYPTAFTLMGLGAIFGFIAFWDPAHHWWQNRIFDLIAQRTYGVMTNDTLLSVPLFVFMGYIMERAALVDRMFHSVQLAFRRVPASLAVTTLLVCAFWGIASGIVGAVVVLMGVIAMRPMLNAGYDVKLASGAITAGGTLGILIPPSVMLIVYAAVAGQSIVKLYAAAMLPGFFLTFLYLVYILGWAIINPRIAPKLSPDQYRVQVPDYLRGLERGPMRRVVGGVLATALRPGRLQGLVGGDGRPVGYRAIAHNLLVLSVPLLLTVGTFAATWWYVVIYNAPEVATAAAPAPSGAAPAATAPVAKASVATKPAATEDKPQELGAAGESESEPAEAT